MTATAPMSTKRAQTQDRLMDAATALFAEKGVLAASVEEICERAGFTRGAFYSNFESKDELLLAVVQRKREAILKAATDAIDSIPDEPIEPQTLDEIIKQALLIFQASNTSVPSSLNVIRSLSASIIGIPRPIAASSTKANKSSLFARSRRNITLPAKPIRVLLTRTINRPPIRLNLIQTLWPRAIPSRHSKAFANASLIATSCMECGTPVTCAIIAAILGCSS